MGYINEYAPVKRILLLLAFTVLLAALQGCTYLRNRYHDVCDLVDVGVTVSAKPCFAAYADAPFVELFPIGIADVSGRFIGIGGGNIRFFSPHHESNFGLLLWGHEERTFEYDAEDLLEMTEEQRHKVLSSHNVGVLGTLQDLVTGNWPTLRDFGSCPHYIHLGFIGVVGTVYYWEMFDAAIGLLDLDPSWDDNRWEDPKP